MITPPHFDATFEAGLIDLLRWRRDVRHFDNRPVAEDDMQHLLATAALAPSVGNAQPWRFVRVKTPALREGLAAHVDQSNTAAADAMPDDARRDHYRALKLHGLREAPEVLAVFSDEAPEAGHGLGIATMREALRYSTVTAVHTLWLAARVRGIGVGWVSIVEPTTVVRLLDTPDNWVFVALLCIGYPAEESDVPELERRGWQDREPIGNRIFTR